MKCDSCQEKATVFYTQVSEGKLKKFVLCETCAEAQGITKPEGLLMAEELFTAGTTGSNGDGIGPDAVVDTLDQCLSCGFTHDDLQKIGRLGCPDCYRAFAGEIARRLPSMHNGSMHAGYMPAGLARQQALQAELSDLETDLDAAIGDEDFETAAKLRDRINDLKEGSANPAPKGKGVAAS